jgi:hypothetical protein
VQPWSEAEKYLVWTLLIDGWRCGVIFAKTIVKSKTEERTVSFSDKIVFLSFYFKYSMGFTVLI